MTPTCWIDDLVARPGGLSRLEVGYCSGALVRAHLIPKQRIARELKTLFRSRGVSEDDALKEIGGLLWDPRCWVPICGGPMGNAGHHGMLDSGGVRRIKLERAWLPPAVEEFAVEYGLGWSLEADYGPKER